MTNRRDDRKDILEILQNLKGIEPLKELFWERLNYDRSNQPLPRANWSTTARDALVEDPILWATGVDEGAFKIIYARLASERLPLGKERPMATSLLRDHPYALFVFSNEERDYWHFVNVRAAGTDDAENQEIKRRRLFRRITVGREERLRTAAKRITMLDLQSLQPDLIGLSPLAIQQRHDKAFDVEAVTKDFFKTFAKLYHIVVDDITETPGLAQEARQLAQLLLDRLLSLYFIQKKGWLDQSPNYLYERFKQCIGQFHLMFIVGEVQ